MSSKLFKVVFAGAVTAAALLLPVTAAQAAVKYHPCDEPGFDNGGFFGDRFGFPGDRFGFHDDGFGFDHHRRHDTTIIVVVDKNKNKKKHHHHKPAPTGNAAAAGYHKPAATKPAGNGYSNAA